MKPTVFISYNHRDKGVAHRVKAKLEANGFPVIIDSEAMKAGEDIKSFIEACIRKSDVTLSLVSENSLLSAWVAMESINSFYDEKVRGQRFVPVALSGAFFARDFVDRALERVEGELDAIKELIMGRLDKGLGFEDLQNERTRYNQLKANLPEIVRRLRESLTVDISGDNFEAGMDKVLEGLAHVPPKGGAGGGTPKPAKDYILPNINRLLMHFTDESLNLMAMFHFEMVHRNFTAGQSKQERAMKLIAHCREFLEMDRLLQAAEEQNPGAFQQFKPYF